MMNEREFTHPCDGPRGFGSFLPFLAIPITIGLMMGMKHRHMHMQGYRRQEWVNGVPPMFAEWHRRAHESQDAGPVQSA
jgi:hypothetical protein